MSAREGDGENQIVVLPFSKCPGGLVGGRTGLVPEVAELLLERRCVLETGRHNEPARLQQRLQDAELTN